MPNSLPDLCAADALTGAVWESLRMGLDALGLDAERLTRFDFVGPDLGDSFRLPYQQWCAREEGTAAGLAAAFFRLGEAVSETELRTILDGELARILRAAGLVAELPDGCFQFTLKLGCLGDRWILSDADLTRENAVMGASAATNRLLDAVWQQNAVDSMLDLGCGGGALALALSGMAGRTVGCDISQRALVLAAINAKLNGVAGVDFRHGDLFAPVAGERFSRVMCQPPFIPSLEQGATFASGGALGDGVTLRILREMHRHLAPGGRAVLCVEWARSEDNEWQPRFREAVAGAALHVIHFDCFRTAAEDYCVMLAPYLHPVSDEGYGAFVKAMLNHYRRHGIRTIDLVIHAIEPAPDGVAREWVQRLSLESLPYVKAAAIDARFAALRLAEAPDAGVLDASLCAAAGLGIAEGAEPDAPVVWAAAEPSSLARSGFMDGDAVRLAMRFGSAAMVREAVGPEADSRMVGQVRDLLRSGHLCVADAAE